MASWRDLAHPLAGGAEEYTDHLLTALTELGHDVTLFTSRFKGSRESESRNGYRILRAGGRLTVYRAVKHQMRGLAEEHPDLMIEQVNTIPFLLSHIKPQTTHGALIFQTCEDIWPYILRPPFSWLAKHVLEPTWLRHFRDIPTVTLTRSNRIALERFGLRRVRVVPPGRIAAERVAMEKFGTPTCVHVGRLVRYKRIDKVIRACEEARLTVPNLRLIVIGDGPDAKRLKRRSPDWVDFRGRLSRELRDETVARSHLQVIGSVREGWGLVVTEAAELGTPSLGFAVPGLQESISAAGGWLSPTDDAAFARWLIAVLPLTAEQRPKIMGELGCIAWTDVAHRLVSALMEQRV